MPRELLSHEEKLNVVFGYFQHRVKTREATLVAMEIVLTNKVLHDSVVNARFYNNQRGMSWVKPYLEGLFEAYEALARSQRIAAACLMHATVAEVRLAIDPDFAMHPIVAKSLRRWKQYRHNLAK